MTTTQSSLPYKPNGGARDDDFELDATGSRWQLKPIFRERIELLISELRRLPRGYIAMNRWTDPRVMYLSGQGREAAEANPCGTACCLAGKAGLMKVFQDQGFSWRFDSRLMSMSIADLAFTVKPAQFFGHTLTEAVFIGSWAKANLHSTRQAIVLLEAFLEDPFTAWEEGFQWQPNAKVIAQILRLRPRVKRFPVSGLTQRWDDEDRIFY